MALCLRVQMKILIPLRIVHLIMSLTPFQYLSELFGFEETEERWQACGWPGSGYKAAANQTTIPPEYIYLSEQPASLCSSARSYPSPPQKG